MYVKLTMDLLSKSLVCLNSVQETFHLPLKGFDYHKDLLFVNKERMLPQKSLCSSFYPGSRCSLLKWFLIKIARCKL